MLRCMPAKPAGLLALSLQQGAAHLEARLDDVQGVGDAGRSEASCYAGRRLHTQEGS